MKPGTILVICFTVGFCGSELWQRGAHVHAVWLGVMLVFVAIDDITSSSDWPGWKQIWSDMRSKR